MLGCHYLVPSVKEFYLASFLRIKSFFPCKYVCRKIYISVVIVWAPTPSCLATSVRLSILVISILMVKGQTNHLFNVFCVMTQKCLSQKQYKSRLTDALRANSKWETTVESSTQLGQVSMMVPLLRT